MSITKWKNPSTGETETPAVYSSPFGSLMENFFNDSLFAKEFSVGAPAVNVLEDEGQYELELSAPGYRKEDFKIESDNNMLTISAEHKMENETKNKTFTRKEFNYDTFRRSFTLPETVNAEKINAKYDNGILKVTLQKKEEAKTKHAKEIKIS